MISLFFLLLQTFVIFLVVFGEGSTTSLVSAYVLWSFWLYFTMEKITHLPKGDK